MSVRLLSGSPHTNMSITLHSRKALTAYRGVLRAIRDHVAPAAQTADAWMNAASAEFRKYQHVTDAKERERLLKVATEYSSMLNAVADHQRLLLKYGWGVARSQRDEIERMVSRVGLRTPMPPEYMEFHEKQQRAEVDSVRQAREAALADGDLYVSEHVSPAAVAASTSLDDSPSSSPAGISNSAESEALVAPSAANSAAATAAAAESTRKLFRSSPKPAPSK